MAELCPCGSEKEYAQCCQPLHTNQAKAETAEALMRSRYSAYVKAEIDYIFKTTIPKQRETLDEKATRDWATKTAWQKLEILHTEKGGPEDKTGIVEFAAHFSQKGERRKHHEVGRFTKQRGSWYYEDGELPAPAQIVNTTPKIGRNDPCSCGSGKKFKKCCMGK